MLENLEKYCDKIVSKASVSEFILLLTFPLVNFFSINALITDFYILFTDSCDFSQLIHKICI